MNKFLILTVLCFLLLTAMSLAAILVNESTALVVANHQLSRINAAKSIHIANCELLRHNDITMGYVFLLVPVGYIVISADDRLSPVIAYSTQSEFSDKVNNRNILAEILTADLSNRMRYAEIMPESIANRHRNDWDVILQERDRPRRQQWPPEGSTSTGGWVKTRWNQSAPYNALCPMDNVTNHRSLAGCPTVAMGQIVNYYVTINGTTFSDADDYQHNYGGNSYWIDNDSTAFGFPSFSALNGYLDTAMHHYRYQEETTNTDKAAVIFGCAIAATQIFGSAGSGTFSVNQAMTAYQRFNFTGMELLSPPDTTVNTRIAQNMMDARPVHYAIVTPAGDAGHNVVVDGYNTDGFFHVNFGWGGQYDGWYLLPSGLPYNLTVLEGAIVDIQPYKFAGVLPESLDIMTMADALAQHEFVLWNNSTLGDITVEAYDFNESFANAAWVVNGLDLPVTLSPGESITFTLQATVPSLQRDTLETSFRLVLNNSVVNVPIRWNEDVQDASDNTLPVNTDMVLKQNYPNPFNSNTALEFTLVKNSNVTLSVYNLKGEWIIDLSQGNMLKGHHSAAWNGKDADGKPCPSGMYLYKLKNSTSVCVKKMLLIR